MLLCVDEDRDDTYVVFSSKLFNKLFVFVELLEIIRGHRIDSFFMSVSDTIDLRR